MQRLRRRLRRAGLVVAVVMVALVMGSERWNGPFTFESIQQAAASATGVTVDDPLAGRPVGTVYLTFDDGPSREWTPLVLDTLAEHDARATFFPIGAQVDGGSALLARAVADGHRVGNHTWNHDRLASIDRERFDRTVGRTQRAVVRATGTSPSCLRPPGGVIDATARSFATDAGLSVEGWTVDPRDWVTPGHGAIVDEVLREIRAGSVVLLHDGGGDRGQTVRALDELLDRLDRAGFRFEPLPGC